MIQRQYSLHNRPVVLSRGKLLQKLMKFLIFRPCLICFIKDFFQHVLAQQLHFRLIRHPEARIQTDQVKMAAQYLQTEAVDRRDLRVVDQYELALQVFIVRLLLRPHLKRIPDPLAHLCRRRIRKRHDEEPVNIHRMHRRSHHLQNTSHQHSRLS